MILHLIWALYTNRERAFKLRNSSVVKCANRVSILIWTSSNQHHREASEIWACQSQKNPGKVSVVARKQHQRYHSAILCMCDVCQCYVSGNNAPTLFWHRVLCKRNIRQNMIHSTKFKSTYESKFISKVVLVNAWEYLEISPNSTLRQSNVGAKWGEMFDHNISQVNFNN